MKKEIKYTTEDQNFANLEKFQSIDMEGDWDIVKKRIGFRKSRTITPLWRVAALFILILGFGYLARQYVFTPTVSTVVMAGEMQKELQLPDGSKVWLNKYAALTYPTKFKKNIREIKLTGEGFFEVTHDPGRPFIVNVNDLASVEVLGTSFNINAHSESESVRVHVVEGRIAFYSIDRPDSRELLDKDAQAIWNNGVISIPAQTDKNYLSWKTGLLYFDQVQIDEVIRDLGEYYDRELILENSVDKSLTFTSTIDNQDLESVLEELSLVLGLTFTLDNKKIILSGSE